MTRPTRERSNKRKYMINQITAVVFSVVIFVALSTVAFAGGMKVEGAKAVSKVFKTITVSWDEVLIEAPEEPSEPSSDPLDGTDEAIEEPVDAPGIMTEPVNDAPAADIVDVPAADMADAPTADIAGEEAADLSDEEAADSADERIEDPQYVEITYKVYRATARKGKYKCVATTTKTQFKDHKVTAGKTYYYKIKAKGDGVSIGYSSIVHAKVLRQKKASLSLIKKGGSFFNFRVEAKQKLYKYDTLQGACANNGYAYLTLYDRNVEKCKIVKVDLSGPKVVRVSKALPVYHANSLTYNTRKNLLVATCCQVKGERAVFVNPNTLKVKSHKDIHLTSSVKDLPSKVRRNYVGFTAIAYNKKHNCYVGRLRYSSNVIIFDSRLNPKKYVKLHGKKRFLLNQGMESVGDYIYDVRSFKGRHKYSMVTIHKMNGGFVGQIRVPYGKKPGNELQCVFHDGKQFYAGFYRTTSQYNDNRRNKVKRYNKLYKFNNLTRYLPN